MTKILSGLILSLLFLFSIQIHASPISANVIYGFTWDGDGTDDPTVGAEEFDGGVLVGTVSNPGTGPWTFSGEGNFEILDLDELVDQFSVFDNGVLLGISSIPGGGVCADVADCFFDPNASYGNFALGGGDHSITILANGGNTGLGVFRFSAPSPRPRSFGTKDSS